MDLRTVLLLLAGTAAMAAVMILCRKQYGISLWKALFSAVLLTLIGVLSVKLMFWLENGNFSGLSFFGAVFFIPVFALPVAWLLRIPYADYLDISAPSIAVMLGVMKVGCLISGCCKGKILAEHADGSVVRFPSQIFEMICALLIAAFLISLIQKGILTRKLYPFFMVLYGLTRFLLNLFRETEAFWWGMGIGNCWAILSTVLGILLLVFLHCTKKCPRPQN